MNLDDIGWFMMALKECRLVSARLKLYKGMSSLEVRLQRYFLFGLGKPLK